MNEGTLVHFGQFVMYRVRASIAQKNIFSARFREDAFTAELLYRAVYYHSGKSRTQMVTLIPDPKVGPKLNTESVTGADFLWEIEYPSSTRFEAIQAKKILTKKKSVEVDHQVTWSITGNATKQKSFQSNRLLSYSKHIGFTPYYLFYLDPLALGVSDQLHSTFDGQHKYKANSSLLIINADKFLNHAIWQSVASGTASRRYLTGTKIMQILSVKSSQTQSFRAHIFSSPSWSKHHSSPTPQNNPSTPQSLENIKSEANISNTSVDLPLNNGSTDENLQLTFSEFMKWRSNFQSRGHWLLDERSKPMLKAVDELIASKKLAKPLTLVFSKLNDDVSNNS